MTLHSVLCHLELQGTYAPLLFVDYSSAFNTILTSRLFSKMSCLGIPLNLCLWTKDFLTNRPQAVRMAAPFPHFDTQHRGPTGLRAEPFALLSVHTWLHSISHYQHHSEIRRWHNCGGTDHQRWWVCLQRGGSKADRMVLREQPESQHQKNKRTDHRLQEEAGHTHTTTHQRREGGESVQLQMDNKHHSNSKESTAAVILSPHTQESQSLTTTPEVLLSLLHWECARLWHPVVVW